MEKIAFLPLTRTNWPIMVRLAMALKSPHFNGVRPVMVLSNRLTKTLAAGLEDGIELVETPDFPGPPVVGGAIEPGGLMGRLKGILRSIARSAWIIPVVSSYKSWVVGRQLTIARRILTDISPRAVVASGDRSTGFEPLFLRAAQDLGIAVVIPPSAFSAPPEISLITRRQQPGHRVTHMTNFKLRFPNQWRRDGTSGEDLSYFGVATTNAYNRHGMLPNNPWVLGGGLSDWIMVESEDVKRRYVALGVAPEKIVVTGHPDHDELAVGLCQRDAVRARLVERYSLDPAKKMLVLYLPTWAESEMKSWEWHWRENELLCSYAARQKCNVLISLHPTQQRSRYAYLVKRHPGLTILDERLAVVLPAVDIYFTGLCSSTVPWAVLSGVPTVMAFHYPEKDLMNYGLPGVVFVNDSRDLGSVLSHLIDDECYFQELRSQQLESRHLYGALDNKAMNRILEKILTAKPRNSTLYQAYAP